MLSTVHITHESFSSLLELHLPLSINRKKHPLVYHVFLNQSKATQMQAATLVTKTQRKVFTT